jgi:hypothetical protein
LLRNFFPLVKIRNSSTTGQEISSINNVALEVQCKNDDGRNVAPYLEISISPSSRLSPSICNEHQEIEIYQKSFALAELKNGSLMKLENDDDDDELETTSLRSILSSSQENFLKDLKSIKMMINPNEQKSSLLSRRQKFYFVYSTNFSYSPGFIAGICCAVLICLILAYYSASQLYQQTLHSGTIQEYQVKTLAQITRQAQLATERRRKEWEKEENARNKSNNNNTFGVGDENNLNNNNNNIQNDTYVVYDSEGNVIINDEEQFLAMFDEDGVLSRNNANYFNNNNEHEFYSGNGSKRSHRNQNNGSMMNFSRHADDNNNDEDDNDLITNYDANRQRNRNRQLGVGRTASSLMTRGTGRLVVGGTTAGLGNIRPMVFDAFSEIMNEEDELMDDINNQRQNNYHGNNNNSSQHHNNIHNSNSNSQSQYNGQSPTMLNTHNSFHNWRGSLKEPSFSLGTQQQQQQQQQQKQRTQFFSRGIFASTSNLHGGGGTQN